MCCICSPGKLTLQLYPGDTVDVHPDLNPTYVDDAQTLKNVPVEQYDLVLADPPYSTEDADHYMTSPVKRNDVMRALARSARRGAHRMARSSPPALAQGYLRSHGRGRDRQVYQPSLPGYVYIQEEVTSMKTNTEIVIEFPGNENCNWTLRIRREGNSPNVEFAMYWGDKQTPYSLGSTPGE